MQSPSRDVEVPTDFGNMDRPRAGSFEIIVDFSYQLHRRGRRSSGVRRHRMHDRSGYGVHDCPLPEIGDGVG